MHSTEVGKTLIQCDFDGTITENDVGFMMLDAYADDDWRQLLAQYREGKISVNYFNSHVFGMIKEDTPTLLKCIEGKVKIRTGARELIDYCRKKYFQFVIVSNGLSFYIKALLRDIGIENIEVFAAQTRFSPEGLEAWYEGPDGNRLEDGFKEAYVRLFLRRGYRVVYIGNGISDVSPAKLAHHVFATGDLLVYCKEMDISCIPFVDLNDVVRELERLPLE
jgi:2-hydroxy-3-keto-5-methylthiopentenyl-1-phosphate phosphatase